MDASATPNTTTPPQRRSWPPRKPAGRSRISATKSIAGAGDAMTPPDDTYDGPSGYSATSSRPASVQIPFCTMFQ